MTSSAPYYRKLIKALCACVIIKNSFTEDAPTEISNIPYAVALLDLKNQMHSSVSACQKE
jgi:hypothetical protein